MLRAVLPPPRMWGTSRSDGPEGRDRSLLRARRRGSCREGAVQRRVAVRGHVVPAVCAEDWGLAMKAHGVTRSRARKLRRELTDAERIVWSRIKENQLRGWQFRCQHPIGPYILDFACAKLKLAVEIDGATHASLPERLHDARRERYLGARGWVVMRFWNDEVYRNLTGVIETIQQALPVKTPRPRTRRAALPPPSR
jgi:very-short-patch-repair endonuclease